ncbi:MAG: hypothetical protein AAFU65_12525, partial [Pseudomonadota bacterium]
LQLLSFFASRSKKAAIAEVAVNKALSIAQAIQNTGVAVTKALAADPTGALAARVKALGALQVASIAATGLGQISSLSSGGTIGTPGTPANPLVTTTTETQGTVELAERRFQIDITGADDDDLIGVGTVRRLIAGVVDEINRGGGGELRVALSDT